MTTAPRRQTAVHSIPLGRAAALALSVAVVPAAAIALGASGATSGHSATARVVSSAENSKYGRILVSGRTVYTLKPSAVACRATCLKYWPEVLLPVGVTHATAGAGVSAAKLGTLKRGSRLQITYGGRALYWFFKDTAAGQVKGNVKDTWGAWSVVVLAPRAPAPTTSTTGPATTTTKPDVTTTTVKVTTTTAPSGGGGGGAGF